MTFQHRKSAVSLWDEAAETYVSSQESSPFAEQNKEIVTRRFSRMDGMTVLDLGCGAGWYTEYFRTIGARAVGCDGSEKMISMAKSSFPSCQFNLTDLNISLPYQDQTFDLVFSNQVLMDIENLDAAVSEAVRVLKPGGVFFISIVHPAFYDAPWQKDSTGFCRYKRMERYLSQYSFENAFWGTTKHYHRPISAYIRAAVTHGLKLTSLEEPEAYDGAEKSREFPLFLFCEFVKD